MGVRYRSETAHGKIPTTTTHVKWEVLNLVIILRVSRLEFANSALDRANKQDLSSWNLFLYGEVDCTTMMLVAVEKLKEHRSCKVMTDLEGRKEPGTFSKT